MQDIEIRHLRNGNKSANWKKAIPIKIALQEANWRMLDIKEDHYSMKKEIKEIEMEEADDKKTKFITLKFEDKDMLTFTAAPEILDLFYTCISLILNKSIQTDYTTQSLSEFRKLIINRLNFKKRYDKEYAIPELPPEPTCFPCINPNVLKN